MNAATLTKAVTIVDGFKGHRPILEASGGVNLETVRGLAETGIDVISIGGLTHSAPNFDIVWTRLKRRPLKTIFGRPDLAQTLGRRRAHKGVSFLFHRYCCWDGGNAFLP